TKNGKAKQQFKRDLWVLAQIGRQLHARISGRSEDPRQSPVQWEERLRQARVLQIARTGPAQYTFPWALVYHHALPLENAAQWKYCDVLEEWSAEGERQGQDRRLCPVEEREGKPHGEGILCPYGFWGLRHMIEQPLAAYSLGSDSLQDTPDCFQPGSNPALAIGATADPELDLRQLQAHLHRVATDLGGGVHVVAPGPNPADTAAGVRAILADCEIAYFICHGEDDEGRTEPYIGVGLRDRDPAHRIYPTSIAEWRTTQEPPNLQRWVSAHPLVFINGCHTAELMPGSMLNFVNQFGQARASGVLGTEVSIRLPLATEVAESLLRRVVGGAPVGQALYEVRWELANKGNLLGLAYTYYGLIGPGAAVSGGAAPRASAATAELALADG
ncbi:MAG TPA: hypothetical protein VF832_04175, partial [Longimicrobiales bacterium]